VIVGAGASGGAVAWRLAAAGIRVVCLEQGDWVDPAASPALREDWEAAPLGPWHSDPNVRRLPSDYPVNGDRTPLKPRMYNAVGGSMTLWGAHFPRFHPSDFRMRTLDGVGDDWPLSYWDLEPYYELNDSMNGVAGLSGDPATPPRRPDRMPPIPLGRGELLLAKGFDELGWHWWPADTAINTVPYRGRAECNHCGPCDLNCTRGARATSAITYWPEAINHGAELITRARVRRVTTDSRGLASGVDFVKEGVEQHLDAGAVVMAANAIGTARLLLVSSSAQFPLGLANSSGLVGKRLMHHPMAHAYGVFEEYLDGARGNHWTTLISQQFYETDPVRDFVRGYSIQAARSRGPLSTALGFAIPWGEGHGDRFLELFNHTVALWLMTDDLPDEANRLTLDPELKDGDGIPAPAVRYSLGANTKAMLRHALQRSREVLEAAGAREILQTPQSSSTVHLMGTCRMGDDPDRSVVDGWGRSHDVRNLFIVDGSVFVTAAAVNPTSTIQALALRTADHLIETRRDFS
jgi:choline dehydrogenase-like flavoprotein